MWRRWKEDEESAPKEGGSGDSAGGVESGGCEALSGELVSVVGWDWL